MTQEWKTAIDNLLIQFGDEVKIKVIAQYAQDEFLIPYDEAVKLIYDSTN